MGSNYSREIQIQREGRYRIFSREDALLVGLPHVKNDLNISHDVVICVSSP